MRPQLKVFGFGFFICFALQLFLFWPSQSHFVGFGDDPHFNIWTIESVWKNLKNLGLFSILSQDFWTTNIYYPQKLSLALSENQIFPALITYPAHFFGMNTVFILHCFAIFLGLCSYVFTYLWLIQLDENYKIFKSSSNHRLMILSFLALMYSCSGWLQSQLSHYQNIYLFLLPLFLWRFEKLRTKRSIGNAIVLGLALGWIAGWNLYFQVFANLIFAIFLIKNFIFERKTKLYISPFHFMFVSIIASLMQISLLYNYIKLQSFSGKISFNNETFHHYSANILSFFQHVQMKSLSQYLFHWPSPTSNSIESVGYVGLTYLMLFIGAFQFNKARLWIVLALIFLGISFGPQAGIFHLFKVFPGFTSLRAIGRFQILFLLFSLPAIAIVLNSISKKHPNFLKVVLLILVFELLPGQKPPKVNVMTTEGAIEQIHLIQSLSKSNLIGQSILVLPSPSTAEQLQLNRLNINLLGGYSGRSFKNFDLLIQNIKDMPKQKMILIDSLPVNFIYLRKTRLELKNPLLENGRWKIASCLADNCLLERVENYPEDRIIKLKTDTYFDKTSHNGRLHSLKLFSNKEGILSYADLSSCRIRQEVYWMNWNLINKVSAFPTDHLKSFFANMDSPIHEFTWKSPAFFENLWNVKWAIDCIETN